MEQAFLGIFILLLVIFVYLYKRNRSKTLETFNTVSLSDFEGQVPQFKNPEYLLPSNNTATDPGSEDGEDYYKDLKIRPTISDSKVVFERDNIVNLYSSNINFNQSKKEDEVETDDSMLARFMVPLLWQITKNQIEDFSRLESDIQYINNVLRAANIKMIKINTDVNNLGPDAISKKRSNDFDFKKF